MDSGQHCMDRLVREFTKLPGIGKKSAQRIAYAILQRDKSQAENLAHAILEAKEQIHLCSRCYDYTETDLCPLCKDTKRDQHIICVVEQPKDVAAMERAREYHGLYHVLHGVISPLEDKGPEQLKLAELLDRMDREGIQEVIIATNPTVEGEATSRYIAKLLEPYHIKVTRIAHGIPMGSTLEYFDEVTLALALMNRREADK